MTSDIETAQKIAALKAEEKERLAALKAEDRDRKKAERLELIAAAAHEFITAHDLRYSIKHGLYLMKASTGWIFAKKASLVESIPAWCDDMNAQLKAIMEAESRMYKDVTISFNPHLSKDIFNMLDMSGWLKPTYGQPHHWLFDALMQALGSDKPENIDHIKRVLAYKVAHPECYTLPVLVFWGEGGTGKNLLVQCVLKTVFDGAAEALGSDKVFGQFNSLLKALAVALIDEAVDAKVDGNGAKALFHNPTIKINEKGIIDYVVDNTPLYIIASNKNGGGGVWLDRTDADRRYSVMRCEDGLTLAFFVALQLGINEEEAKDWLFAEGQKIATDPVEVAKWLGNLLAAYEGQKQPRALHGRDFHALAERQKPVIERLCEAVFLAKDVDTNADAFTHIELMDLLDCYKTICKEDGVRNVARRNTFYDDVRSWLKTHAPHVKEENTTVARKEYDPDNHQFGHSGGSYVVTRKKIRMWVNTRAETSIDRTETNRYHYLKTDGLGFKFRLPID
jgi:hypothetical protein